MAYKVLWIDDQWKDQEGFIVDAEQDGIYITPFAVAVDGLKELEANLDNYDGVILDARGWKNSKDEVADVHSLSYSMARMEQLKTIKVIPYFIYTGQPGLMDDRTFIAMLNGKTPYEKGTDNQKLLNDIKSEIDALPDTKLLYDHQAAFAICTDKYIGNEAKKALLYILKKENAINAFSDSELYFNALRKVVEDLFIGCNKYGIFPDEFTKGTVALTESRKFLNGDVQRGFQLNKVFLPSILQDHLRNILNILQSTSHRSEIDTFVNEIKSPNLLLSVTYQLLDVLIWFKSFMDKNSDTTINKANYTEVIGIIEQDSRNNYHCKGITISPQNVTSKNYKVGDKIKILKAEDNDFPATKKTYPKSIIDSIKL